MDRLQHFATRAFVLSAILMLIGLPFLAVNGWLWMTAKALYLLGVLLLWSAPAYVSRGTR